MKSSTEFNIPDEAISFIVSNYLRKKSVEAVSLTVGVPSSTVEDIVTLFLLWAEKNALVEGTKLTIDLGDF